MTQVVAGHVFAVLHELDREAAIRAFVIANAQAFDEGAGLESQRLGAGDDIGLQIIRHEALRKEFGYGAGKFRKHIFTGKRRFFVQQLAFVGTTINRHGFLGGTDDPDHTHATVQILQDFFADIVRLVSRRQYFDGEVGRDADVFISRDYRKSGKAPVSDIERRGPCRDRSP